MFQIYEVEATESQALEPMGSKAKFWFEHEDLGPCLFKEARPHTGEDWSEKVAAEIAGLLGLPHAKYELAVCEGARGVITPRLTANDEELVHGNELLIEIDPAYELKSVEYRTPAHTVGSVVRALREAAGGAELPKGAELPGEVTDAVGVLAGYLLLDALIGNTDRHHENWALIRAPEKAGTPRYKVAPTFDHASSLGRNEPLERVEERLTTNDRGFTVEAYAAKARSALFSSADDSAPLAPLDAFGEITRFSNPAARAWCQRLDRVTHETLQGILDRVPEDRMPESVKQFVVRMVMFNRQQLIAVCEEL